MAGATAATAIVEGMGFAAPVQGAELMAMVIGEA
jgi:hypothetical protein